MQMDVTYASGNAVEACCRAAGDRDVGEMK